MGRRGWLLLTVAAVGLPVAAHRPDLAVLAAVVIGLAYLVAVRVHPRTRHRRCRGTGEHRGLLFTWGHRRCPRCRSGRIIRRGAAWFGTAAIQAEHRREVAEHRRARANHTWR
jgi:hypothetical protein